MLSKINIRKIIILLVIFCIILENVVIATFNEDKNLYIESNLQYQNIDGKGNLKIYSESAILIEKTTGEILYEKNAYDKKYPASTTKILTAILAIEQCDLNEKVIASKNAIFSVKSGYSIADIQEGEIFTVEQLLEVMILQSANEAANILAEHISGSIEQFAILMNQKAKEIGCQNTHFVNANGAHEQEHYSTAYDMAQIAKYCMKNEVFRKISSKMECSLPITDKWQKERVFKNTNSLMNSNSRYYYPYCTGLKTGYTTPAKNCLVSTSNKDGFELISVILHAETTEDGLSARYLDTINLFNYGYKQYKLEDIQEEYDLIGYSDMEDFNINSFQIEKKEMFSTVGKKELKDKFEFNKMYLVIIIGVYIIFYKKKKRKKKVYQNKSIYNKLYDFKYDL